MLQPRHGASSPPSGNRDPHQHTRTTALNNREKVQTSAMCPSSNVVNIYLKNTTEEMWIQKTESYTETKCTGPRKKKKRHHRHLRRENSGKLFTCHL